MLRLISFASLFLVAGLTLAGGAFAQEAASANWPLVQGSEQFNATIVGQVDADPIGGTNLVFREYSSGQQGPLGSAMQRWWKGTGVNWPIEATYNPNRYVQFRISPESGRSFSATNIRFAMGSHGTDNMRAAIYYSASAAFTDAVELYHGATARDSYALHTYDVDLSIPAGQSLYVRVFPYVSSGTAGATRTISFQDVWIEGTTAATGGSFDLPTVVTASATDVTGTSATGGGDVTADGGAEVTARGVVWSTSPSPTLADASTSDGAGLGSFTSHLSGLTAGTTYYVRAYATNVEGTAYGNEISFATLEDEVPEDYALANWPLTPTAQLSFSGTGNVTGDAAAGHGGLVVRSYSSTPIGPLGELMSRWWLDGQIWPEETAYNPARYAEFVAGPEAGSAFSATEISMAIAKGGTNNFWAAIYYSTNADFSEAVLLHDGDLVRDNAEPYYEVMTFAIDEDLQAGDQIRVRVFPYTTAGGDGRYLILQDVQVSGTYEAAGTATLPTVQTGAVTEVTASSAQAGGNVTADGGTAVTARGVVWATSPTPTLADNFTEDGAGTGSFTSSLEGLQAATTYYVRAYATNSEGTAYGSQVSFTTGSDASGDVAGVNWKLTEATRFSYELTGAVQAAEAAGHGGLIVRRYRDVVGPLGVPMQEWWLNDAWPEETEPNPDRYLQFVVSPATDHTFIADRISLAIGSTGTSLMHAAIAFSTDPDFTDATVVFDAMAPRDTYAAHEFEVDVEVGPGASIYLRIFPYTSAGGTGTGRQFLIQDLHVTGTSSAFDGELATVVTAEPAQITATSAVSGGNVTADGGSEVTARGVVWSTSSSPTLADSRTVDGAGTGEFTSELADLEPATTYYVRAYATTGSGTAYGNEFTFRTQEADLPEDAALVSWPLTPAAGVSFTTHGEVTGVNATGHGGLTLRNFTDTPEGPLGEPMSRWWLDNEAWPVENAYNPARFTQFVASANAGYEFDVTEIRLAIGKMGTDNFWAAIYYSTQADFSDAILLYDGALVRNTVEPGYAVHTFEVEEKLNPGESIYVRVYPYTTAGGATRYLTLQDVRVFGTYQLATSVADGARLPESYRLHGNYPNPFNPSTTIAYDLPVAGSVRVVLYNMLGQELRTLVTGERPAGRHEFVFDAGDLPSGTYFYTLEAGGHRLTGRMVLLK
jgi:hypothetical protein